MGGCSRQPYTDGNRYYRTATAYRRTRTVRAFTKQVHESGEDSVTGGMFDLSIVPGTDPEEEAFRRKMQRKKKKKKGRGI